MELSSRLFKIKLEMLAEAIRGECLLVEGPINVKESLAHLKVSVVVDR